MTAVKICGINSAPALEAAARAGADFVGFVFFEASPRFITPGRAAALAVRRPGGPKQIGLFVAPGDEEVAATLAAVPLDGLQIYADAARCRALQARHGLPVWRAVGVAAAEDLPREEGLGGHVVEAKAPPGASRPGGNARVLDWALLAGWNAPGFWLLGGGLNAGNIREALRITQSPGVDVSSGVETAPGQKSAALIEDLVSLTRKP